LKIRQRTLLKKYVVEICEVKPEDLRLSFALNFYRKKKDYTLPLLILRQNIEAASSGQTLKDMFTKLACLHPQSISYGNYQQTLKRRKEPCLSVILKKLKKTVPYDSKLNQDGQRFIRTLNDCGFLLEDIFNLFKDLMEMKMDCARSLQGTISTKTISALGKPFIQDTNPSVVDLLDLIEKFKDGQFIIPEEPAPQYNMIQDRWNSWVIRQPAVLRYLDPAITIIQDAAIGPVANLNTVIGLLPTFPGALYQPVAVIDGMHGGNFEGMIACDTDESSQALAMVLRTQFQRPPVVLPPPAVGPAMLGAPVVAPLVAGQGHQAARIVTFSIIPGLDFGEFKYNRLDLNAMISGLKLSRVYA